MSERVMPEVSHIGITVMFTDHFMGVQMGGANIFRRGEKWGIYHYPDMMRPMGERIWMCESMSDCRDLLIAVEIAYPQWLAAQQSSVPAPLKVATDV